MKLIKNLKKEIQIFFQNFGPHDFSHTERVYNNALVISEQEEVDKEITYLAALMHDIARMKEYKNKSICHAEEGAKMAIEILKGKTKKILEISYCIKTHRYSKGIVPNTLEAKIIQDADRLDSLGAIAIARTFAKDGMDEKPIYDPKIPCQNTYNGNSATGVNHLIEKVLNIKPDCFYTLTARNMAKKRYNFVNTFVNKIKNEWVGEY